MVHVYARPFFYRFYLLVDVLPIFIVNIESEGPYAPETLVPAAIRSLRSRISVLRHAAGVLASGGDDIGPAVRRGAEVRTDRDVVMTDS